MDAKERQRIRKEYKRLQRIEKQEFEQRMEEARRKSKAQEEKAGKLIEEFNGRLRKLGLERFFQARVGIISQDAAIEFSFPGCLGPKSEQIAMSLLEHLEALAAGKKPR